MSRVVAWAMAWLSMRRWLRVVVDGVGLIAGAAVAVLADQRALVMAGAAVAGICVVSVMTEAVVAQAERMAGRPLLAKPEPEEPVPDRCDECDEWRWIPYGANGAEVHWRCAEYRPDGSCTYCLGVIAEVGKP